jgi:hypothetical protein
VRTLVRVSPITSEEFNRKLKGSKSKKPKVARRTTNFKSESWYANAVLSIGAGAKGETSTH